MAGTLCSPLALLLLLLLLGASSSEARHLGGVVNSETRAHIFYQMNQTLVHLYVPVSGQTEKVVLVDEEVTDYAVDELGDRIFWVAKNGSVFVRGIEPRQANRLVMTSSEPDTKIDYDMITDKLYFTTRERDILALDLKTSNWHVVVTGLMIMRRREYIQRICLDPERGQMFVIFRDPVGSTTLIASGMDGIGRRVVQARSKPFYFTIDYQTKKPYFDSENFAVDGDLKYFAESSELDDSYRIVEAYNGKKPVVVFGEFSGARDLKNLKIYRLSKTLLKGAQLLNPCGARNEVCGEDMMCLLAMNRKSVTCRAYSAREKTYRIKRQIPFDMYSQQPTLRPEPQPTQPDNSYLPVYLSIIGK